MKLAIRYLILSMLLSLLPTTVFAKELTFKVGDPNGKDVVSFSSDAPVELIEGKTSKIDGTVSFDDSLKFDAKHPFKIQIAVDLPSIDTGIPMRNEHMRENFLETGKFPKARFVATSVKLDKKPSLKKAETVLVTATGDFTVHGVTVKKTIPLRVTFVPESALSKKRVSEGDMIRIQGQFPVKLEEHKIQRPEAVFVKLAETVFVNVDTVGTDGKF